ncbi:hypothetical protein CRD60_05500 [Bifidobacterium aemilianum]|uniref:Tubuliform spidroin n=1 Tax=Bifidobacterium aemilianum TaxID=2493120 RepID=A0A366K7G8_9BIFI|nr:hypothetical protein [Bifidobacterium aemilianum]RBP97690.1 hypothetical protein CRD60_05500 [Bifidobacterium aemilianum]
MLSPSGLAKRACAAIVGLALLAAAPLALSASAAPGPQEPLQGSLALAVDGSPVDYRKDQTVMTLADGHGRMGRLFVTDDIEAKAPGTITEFGLDDQGKATPRTMQVPEGGKLSTASSVRPGLKQAPWRLKVTYNLDGPQVPRDRITGANGFVNVHIDVSPNPVVAQSAQPGPVPLVVFTVPTSVTDGITASPGAVVSRRQGQLLAIAVGKRQEPTRFDFFFDARNCSMGSFLLASVDAKDPGQLVEGLRSLAGKAHQLPDQATGGVSKQDRALIEELKALRDQEHAQSPKAIGEKTQDYQQAFLGYMSAYVGAYTDHLSGSIGSSTQMSALLGAAGELKGDTPLSRAVDDLANAVNAMSDAHEHDGAAQAYDDAVRQIERRGSVGMAQRARGWSGDQLTQGERDYKSGQDQLQNAMIPYSMAYTDSYTSYLSALTGGSAGGAAGLKAQALAQTEAGKASNDALKDNWRKVEAGLDSLAAAREHTGQAQAWQKVAQLLTAQSQQGKGSDGSADELSSRQTSVSPGVTRLLSQAAMPARSLAGPLGLDADKREGQAVAGLVDSSDMVDQMVGIADASAQLDAAALALMPAPGQPSPVLVDALQAGAEAGGSLGNGGMTGSDFLTPLNRHTASSNFLMVIAQG